MIFFHLQTVPLKDLDSEFRWSLHQDISPELADYFFDSIATYGLLHPPLLVRQGPDRYEAVCGARRIRAVKEINQQTEIDGLIVDQNLDKGELLLLLAREQLLGGPLSVIQTARLIKLCELWCPDQTMHIVESVAGLRGRHRYPSLLRLLDLELPIRTALHLGTISVATASSFTAMTRFDRIFLSELIAKLSLNHNKQRRLIDLSRIIAASDRCSLQDVFTAGYPHLLQPTIDNIPQATNRLLQDLQQRSHPLSGRARKHFSEKTSSMQLPGNCTISPSPSFEQDRVTLKIEFETFEDCAETWELIKPHLRQKS